VEPPCRAQFDREPLGLRAEYDDFFTDVIGKLDAM
jgi:hypothetical protein